MRQDRLFDLCFGEPVLRGFGGLGPARVAHVVDEEDVDVFAAEIPAVAVDPGLRVLVGAHVPLGHEAVTIPREALQRDAQHLWGSGVGLAGVEEADTAIVRVAD